MVNYKDLAAGVIFIAFGAFFALDAYFRLNIGSAFRMGSGYFPLLGGIVLSALGAAIIFNGIGRAQSPFGNVSWRGIALLSLSTIVFAIAITPLGLIPTVMITVLVSAYASRRMRPLLAIALAVGLTAFCVLVFVLGIGLPLRLFGPVFGY